MAIRVVERYVLAAALRDGERIEANVPFFAQLLTQWCWAACLSMVVPGLTQCSAANRLLNRSDCCDEVGEGCGESQPVRGEAKSDCNGVATRSQISDQWTAHLGRTVTSEGVISENDVQQQLGAGPGHAVQVWWTKGATKHVVLIVGHGGGEFLVFDPCAGPRLLPYDDLVQSAEDGVWEHTWRL
jgi:hypothetical protein